MRPAKRTYAEITDRVAALRDEVVMDLCDSINGFVIEDIAVHHVSIVPAHRLDPKNVEDARALRRVEAFAAEEQLALLELKREVLARQREVDALGDARAERRRYSAGGLPYSGAMPPPAPEPVDMPPPAPTVVVGSPPPTPTVVVGSPPPGPPPVVVPTSPHHEGIAPLAPPFATAPDETPFRRGRSRRPR